VQLRTYAQSSAVVGGRDESLPRSARAATPTTPRPPKPGSRPSSQSSSTVAASRAISKETTVHCWSPHNRASSRKPRALHDGYLRWAGRSAMGREADSIRRSLPASPRQCTGIVSYSILVGRMTPKTQRLTVVNLWEFTVPTATALGFINAAWSNSRGERQPRAGLPSIR
jgi:hypothetical protein